MPIPSELQEFIRLFNKQKFFEAHEVLEILWRSEKQKSSSDIRTQNFYQGLIQIAAALVHVQKKNPEGAQRLFRSASEYLQNIPPNTFGVQTARLIQDTDLCLDHQKPFPVIA